MTDDRKVVPPEIGVAKIGMWQAVLVAAITSTASVFITINVQRPKPPSTEQVNTTGEQPTPWYTENVVRFLRPSEQDGQPYKWNGYRSDVSKLHSLVKDFLFSFKNNPPKYQDADSFYDDIEKAADMVHDKAFAVPFDPSVDKKEDYNWKVYCAEYIFRLEIQQLRAAHMANQLDTEPKIDVFIHEFDLWLLNQSGEAFQVGDL